MNNIDFITTLSRRTGYETKKTVALCGSVVTEITRTLQDNKTVCLPGFGKFDVFKQLESISVNPVTGQKTLEPPCLEVRFEESPVWAGRIPAQNNETSTVLQLLDSGVISSPDSEAFIKDFSSLLSEGLKVDNYVNIKGLGTFKKIEGVVSYVPDSVLRDTINKPFSHFEAVVLADNVDFSSVETDKAKSEEFPVGATCGQVHNLPLQAVLPNNSNDNSESAQTPVNANDDNYECDATHDESAQGLPWGIISTIFLAGLLIGGFLVWAFMTYVYL